MKLIFKKILQYYLKYIAKLILAIHQPAIIAIAGSTNKTFIKDEIIKILKKHGIAARSNPKSFNTEIGLPLAILNLPSGYSSYKNWLPTILSAPKAIFKRDFPRYLVLELGVSDPGDMKYLLSIIKPHDAIITDITQRYLESFSDMDKLALEYEYLAKKIPPAGKLLLNYDNPRVRSIKRHARSQVIFFGLGNGADWQAKKIVKNKNIQEITVKHQDKISTHQINKFGEHHVYALLVRIIIKSQIT